MTHVAVVDIGSNSIRLLLADVSDGRVTAELARESNVTRLGQGVDKSGRLAEEAIERTYAVLERYRQQIEADGAERRIAVLTSAVRDAANGREFAETVRERYGIEPRVLAGEQEAQMTFLGATSERDAADTTPTLVIDIGGGSTELVIGRGHEIDFHVSTQAGVVRQTERHIHHDPPAPGELEALAADVRAIIDASGAVAHQAQRAVAVAGTATQLAAIAQRLVPYDPARVHGFVLTRAQTHKTLDELSRIPLAERRRTPGLHPDRAQTILAGAVILSVVMDLFGLAQVEVSEHDILRGAALSLSKD